MSFWPFIRHNSEKLFTKSWRPLSWIFNRFPQRFRDTHRETHVLESPFQFVEHLQMAAFGFWKFISKQSLIKYQVRYQRKKFSCHQVGTILNLFVEEWLKCTRWNNICFDRISTSAKCRQKKSVSLKGSVSKLLSAPGIGHKIFRIAESNEIDNYENFISEKHFCKSNF